MTSGEPLEEYKILNENMRWFSNVRLAQLTLFVAISAGLLTVLFSSSPPLALVVAIALKVAGILVSVLFWMLEELAANYWRHFRHRAEELEKELGFRQYSTVRHYKVGSTVIFRLFFILIIMIWVGTLFFH